MTTILVERNIAASANSVWAVLNDYGGVHKFMSSVDRSYILEGAKSAGLGADRQCDLARGGFVRERVTDWRDGEYYTAEVYEGAMPTRHHFGTFGVKRLNDTHSTAYMRMDYQMKFGLLGDLMNALIMKRMIRKLLGQVLTELDRHISKSIST